MGKRLEIAIAGAGIGGLALATLLARAGHRVRIFDQFETPKPIGSGLMLQQTGLAVLDQLGLRQEIDALGTRIERLWGLTTPSLRPVLDVRYAKWRSDIYGLGVQRGLLFDALYQAAKTADVDVVLDAPVIGAEPDAPALVLKSGERVSGIDLVVYAHGARSNLTPGNRGVDLPYGALWATLPWPENGPFDATALEQRYYKANRMTGVMPSGRLTPDAPETLTYFWSIRADREAIWRSRPLDHWKAKAVALWPETECLMDQFQSHSDLTFARYRHHTSTQPTAGRGFARIGDAWHAASPQLGQGANMALLDAWALAQALTATSDVSDALKSYVRMRRGHVRLYQIMTWMFTPVYQGDSRFLPWLRDWLAAPLSRIWPGPPLLAALVSGAIGSPLKRLALK
ncbi:MAG: FAD-dependent monooxygenase [Hyphomonadaceae bacterium]|nr:FAD-dependent monooxygenase [Hyphomonadaceae bacterium]